MNAQKVLLVEPGNFISNPQTAGDNFFQKSAGDLTADQLAVVVRREFDGLVKTLTDAGIEVIVFRQEDAWVTPDAIFPNNWFSTLPGGTVVLYPMMAENRRLERRADIIRFLDKSYPHKIDLTRDEQRGIFLEGTGSLVVDHANRTAYASLSKRTSINMVFEWSKLTGYKVVAFTSYDMHHENIYHTNVMMCLADRFAIVCMDAIENEDGRERVRTSLEKTGREIIEITPEQMHHFCGNCLALENKNKEQFLLMSAQSHNHFSDDQREQIEKFCSILVADVTTIELTGGGGARCMVAELF